MTCNEAEAHGIVYRGMVRMGADPHAAREYLWACMAMGTRRYHAVLGLDPEHLMAEYNDWLSEYSEREESERHYLESIA